MRERFGLGVVGQWRGDPAQGVLPRGTTFVYSLSEPGLVAIFIYHQSSGRIVRGHCAPKTKRNARKRRCTTAIRVPGGIIRRSRAGVHVIAFSGRIGRTPLKPGTYRAYIVAQTRNGLRSAPRSATFTILTP